MHKFSLGRLDLSILLPAILIVLLALSAFYSIDTQIFRSQLIFLVGSLFAYVFFLNIDYHVFAFHSKAIYCLMVASLMVLFLIGIEARGAVRWIDIFGLRFQFSEIIKPFFIVFIAQYLARDESRSIAKFGMSFIMLLPIFFLTLKQPDLGNAMIYLITLVFMLFIYGFPARYFVALFALVAAPLPIIFSMLHDYQKLRLMTFFNPAADPFGSSYNAVQSLISIGSGGIFGRGFGQATQSILKFLPERHTDFIFATISESLGFFGGIVLLALYAYLLSRIYIVANSVNESFSRMMIMGFYFLFLTHIFLNIGMNIGVVPIVGVTLPFASYGGSSLLTSFIMLGMISAARFDSRRHGGLEIS
ncbi:MAG TPA: FtsW/RodA/SpoVE family cell cycle protein [Patescibacteria group bacterium]|nr:FtsW/RodA/SpoVE family cell cycle protein [Patescibacteria group bacterium]